MRRPLLACSVALLALVLALGCGGADDGDPAGSPPDEPAEGGTPGANGSPSPAPETLDDVETPPAIGARPNDTGPNVVPTAPPAATPTVPPTASPATPPPVPAGPTCGTGATGGGDGTTYTPLATGACSYPTFEGLYAALSPPDFDRAASCGVCLEVTGPAGTAIVRVVDLCPECAAGDVDLSNAAFAKVAGIPPSRVPVTWSAVECPTDGSVRVRVFEGTNAWYQAFVVLDHRTPLASLEMLPEGGSSWLPLRREPYNVFIRSGGVISAPVRLRATDVYGQTVEGELSSLAPGTETAAGQFPGVCGT